MSFQVQASNNNGPTNRIYLALESMQQQLLSTGDLILVGNDKQVKIKIKKRTGRERVTQ
jgi:hypothetical protein